MPLSEATKQDRKAKGLCQKHALPKPCGRCNEMVNQHRQQHGRKRDLVKEREYRKKSRTKRRTAGLCGDCGEPSGRFSLCIFCRLDSSVKRNAANARKRRTKQKKHEYYIRTRDLHSISTAVEKPTSHQDAIP